VRDAALALTTAALVAVALDAEGLLAWAQRLEVGGPQSLVLAVLRPVSDATESVGLAAPRRALAGGGARVAALFGAGEDPVLAEGWVPAEALHASAEPGATLPVTLGPTPTDDAADDRVSMVAGADEALGGDDAGAPAAEEALDAGEGATDAGAAEAQPGTPEPALAAAPSFLLLGDSMIAGSLGTSLRAALERGGRFRVAHAYQLGTGLARPDVYDWMKVLPALQERERPRFVVVSLGGNDGTNIRDGDEVVDFGTPRWRQLYGARVEAMMRALATGGTRVLWLGLPPMRDAKLGRRAAYLNAVFAASARRVPRVEFLQLDMLVSPGEGRYATFMQGPDGRLLRYRLDDGVHLAPAGSRAIARWVLDWVRERSR
jgi:lysophospholipase L1-like esterase